MIHDFSKDRFDIVIQAGQSNSEGCGFGPVDKAYDRKGNVLYLDPDMYIYPASERIVGNEIVSNFSLSFADCYLNAGLLADDRKLLIIRAAVGGTGFKDNRWKPQDDLFLKMKELIQAVKELNPDNRFIGLLWHQGETDAILNCDNDTYYGHLNTLLSLTRELTGVGNLPFVCGAFVQEWYLANKENSDKILDAQRKLCANDAFSAFVETSDLPSNNQANHNGDTIHFCRSSQYKLGERYFNAYSSIINK